MMIPSAKEMKLNLVSSLNKLCEAINAYQAAGNELNSLGLRVEDRLYMSEAVEKALNCFFQKINTDLTKQYAQGTTAQIVIKPSFYSFRREMGFGRVDPDCTAVLPGSIRRELVNTKADAEVKALLGQLVDHIPFDEIETQLKKDVAGLYTKGLGEMADKLVSFLNIGTRYHPSKVKGRHVVCSKSINSSNYDELLGLRAMNKTLDIIAKESGVSFGGGIHEMISAVEGLSYGQAFESRTTFGKTENLSVVCFSNKYEFRFTHKAFEALSAFVSMHGDESNIEKVMALTSDMAAAA